MRHKISQRRACDLVGISRRRLSYRSKGEDMEWVQQLRDLAQRYPRYGYRMLHQMVKRQWIRQGRQEKLNVKRIRRLCRKYGLTLPRRKTRKRRGQGLRSPCRAEYPNHVWAYDFMYDSLANGRQLKILTVEDEYTRQALGLEVGHRMNAKVVSRTLLALFRQYGTPQYVRSDNGPEFIVQALMRELQEAGVSCRHIAPGSPWQNGKNERFNGTLRRECLDLERFGNLAHAQVIIRQYRQEYNHRRPHSSLGYHTPDEITKRVAGAVSSTRPRSSTRPCHSPPSEHKARTIRLPLRYGAVH